MPVVAHTYAQALFEAAKEQGRLEPVAQELDQFATALKEIPELNSLLRNPQLDPRAKADTLDAVLEDADQLVRNFLRLVSELVVGSAQRSSAGTAERGKESGETGRFPQRPGTVTT